MSALGTSGSNRKAKGGLMSWVKRTSAVALLAVAALALAASAASAADPVFDFEDFTTSVLDRDGHEETRAGAHPFSAAGSIRFVTVPDPWEGDPNRRKPVEEPRDIGVKLPPGFSGNPMNRLQCPLSLLRVGGLMSDRSKCPTESAVGVMTVTGAVSLHQPIFNMVPEVGYPAQFGFSAQEYVFSLYPTLRSDGDYGIDVVSTKSPSDLINDVEATFCSWGVKETGTLFNPTFLCRTREEAPVGTRPFLVNPATECTDVAPVTTAISNSWAQPDRMVERSFASPLVTSCETLEFDPSVEVAPTTSAPDAPTGLDVDMSFPQEDNLLGQAPPALKKAVVTLPEGMSINPSAAGGLAACDDDALNLGSKKPVDCPAASKVGTTSAVSPLLEKAVGGSVYIRSQNSDDPESGELFRLALVFEDKDRGLSIRLPGSVVADKDTGQLTATFDNNPELPVSGISVRFKSGSRAPLATPPTCGTKTVGVELTSWGGQTVNRDSRFEVDCVDGLGGFNPALRAGSLNPVGGLFSPFAVQISKRDGDSAIDAVSVELATGLLAKIKGNLNTQVGSVQAFAGPGATPFQLPGTVTLEGAYGDAPYSLRMVVPAKAGPFDLGEVVVRQKVYVDPVTAQVSVVSDPVPTIVKGVPVRLQRIDVDVDKPGFMINPTSCDAKQVAGTLGSQTGQTVAVTSRFAVGDCAALPFAPRLGLSLTGKKQMRTGKHPGVRAQVRQTGVGEAGIKQAVVTLPPSLALDPDNAQALCEFVDGTKPDLEKHCPAGSIVGRARAKTPLLEHDLTGNVYFVKNVRRDARTGNEIRTLPMIIVALRGEISVNLKGESSTTKSGRLVNTFASVPDAPITQFNLNISGGSNGILAVTRTRKARINVCAKPKSHIAAADFDGHNGKVSDRNVRFKTPCAKKAKTGKPAQRKASAKRNAARG
jgi:hypothetical protein